MTRVKTAGEAPATPGDTANDGVPADAAIEDLAPRQIVTELDKFVVGQNPAKRAVAIALRNRWRRQQLGASIPDAI